MIEKLKNYKICYFETVEVLEYSKSGFFFELLKIISLNLKVKYEDISLHEIISQIDKKIDSILEEKDKLKFPSVFYEVRDRGIGRPTKKDRRAIEKFKDPDLEE